MNNRAKKEKLCIIQLLLFILNPPAQCEMKTFFTLFYLILVTAEKYFKNINKI